MRISSTQVHAIKTEVESSLGAGAQVRLFGSRVDDGACGGDVDLHISLPQAVPQMTMSAARLAARLERRFEGRKVDVRLWVPGQARLAVDDVALSEGVCL